MVSDAADQVEGSRVKSEFVGRGARAPEVALAPQAVGFSQVCVATFRGDTFSDSS